jgi:hypothetical protein
MEVTPQLEGKKILQPALFLAGEKDLVLQFPGVNLDAMQEFVPNLKGGVIVPGAEHWVPAEYPAEVRPASESLYRRLIPKAAIFEHCLNACPARCPCTQGGAAGRCQ